MRVAFLLQGKENGARRHLFAFAKYLRKRGIEVKEIDLSEGELQDKVKELLDFSPMFVLDLDCNSVIFGERDGERIPIFDAFGFVHVSFITEEPLINFPVLLDIKSSTNFLPIVTDIRYKDSLKFLGHERGTLYITPFLDREEMPEISGEKDIEVVFLGPVIDPNFIAKEVVASLKESFVPYFLEVGEFLFRNPEAHVLYANEYILSMFNPNFQEEFNKWRQENPQDYLKLLRDILFYATARKRWYLLSFLEGINLKIVGAFEGELKESHEHIPVDDWFSMLEIVGRSYITILSYPYSMPTGIGFLPLETAYMESVPFIDYRATLPSFFNPEGEIITYLPLDRADIEEKILYYLDNLQEAREIGKRAKERVVQNYTPEDRCEFLYNTFQEILSQAQEESNS